MIGHNIYNIAAEASIGQFFIETLVHDKATPSAPRSVPLAGDWEAHETEFVALGFVHPAQGASSGGLHTRGCGNRRGCSGYDC